MIAGTAVCLKISFLRIFKIKNEYIMVDKTIMEPSDIATCIVMLRILFFMEKNTFI